MWGQAHIPLTIRYTSPLMLQLIQLFVGIAFLRIKPQLVPHSLFLLKAVLLAHLSTGLVLASMQLPPSQAIEAALIGTLTLAFNPGKNNPKVLVPACILLFLGIWIEKGIGLIVPGLVPSPMGEIVDYAPSWVEVSVTLGILALGVFVVSLLLKPALIIEQRYEAEQTSPS